MSLLLRILWLASGLALSTVLGGAAKSEPSPAAVVPPASLIGSTRDDVIAVRGKPSGERVRADGAVVMVYPDGVKFELRDGRVVSASGAGGAEIVAADGTRYVPGADGNIQRPVEIVEPAAPAEGAASESQDASAPPVQSDPHMEEPDIDGLESDAPVDLEAIRAIEQHLEQAEQPPIDFADESEEPPVVLQIAGFLFTAVVRFGLAVLILRLVFHFMGVPFFWPDLLKVALLYLAVHEVLSALGELGGLWEFIEIFKVPDVVSFIILTCSLTWFKIAGNGIAALRIAVATKVAVYILMMGVAFLVLLGLAALR